MPPDNDKTELMGSDEPLVDPDATIASEPGETQPRESQPREGQPSDVRLASDSADATGEGVEDTLAAPSFREPVRESSTGPREYSLDPGERIDDFEVIEVLGRGAFGVVYLARQASLDRRVALKITENRGSEGRTMARLEHDHVVQVFSETVDESGKYRLLCMQLVPGASLEAVIKALNLVALRKGSWTGADYLSAIDERSRVRESFDPSALRDREMLSDSGDVETAAWVGARLAEALKFAHANGVLHRDIKPANVLINQYGRPLLADFNISLNSGPGADEDDTTFGGTLAFMAPEHLEAFSPHYPTTAADVDERSDIYSLGIVVHELLTGRSPFNSPKREGSRTRYVGTLAELRRSCPPPIDAGPPTARKVLQHTVARALAPLKEDRFQSAERLAAALDGCRRMASAERAAPAAGSFARSVINHPLTWAMLLIFLPQVVGSVVNINYNNSQIVDLLSTEQRAVFLRLVTWYNVIVYPVALAALVHFFRPVFRMWRAMQGCERLDAAEVAGVRRAALRLPLWVLTFAAIGWLPGGLLFPAMLQWLTPTIDAHVFLHFIVSFAFSGLIAVAYSFCAMQYIAMRVLYPRLWTDATDFEATTRGELEGTTWRLWFMLGAAYVVPIVATLLLAWFVDDSRAISLKLLVTCISLLGLLGTAIVFTATRVMTKIKVTLTGRG